MVKYSPPSEGVHKGEAQGNSKRDEFDRVSDI